LECGDDFFRKGAEVHVSFYIEYMTGDVSIKMLLICAISSESVTHGPL
jgi:hypothetical protein